MTAWVVRAGGEDQPDVSPVFWDASVAAIGWGTGDLSQVSNREEIKDRLRHVYPDWNNRKLGAIAGNIYRFVHKISVGDLIVTPQPEGGSDVLIGYCAGHYEYRPGLVVNDDDVRTVNWRKKVTREDLSERLRKSLVTALTVYCISEHIEEILGLLGKSDSIPQKDHVDGPPPVVLRSP